MRWVWLYKIIATGLIPMFLFLFSGCTVNPTVMAPTIQLKPSPSPTTHQDVPVNTILVTSLADNGPGSFRDALLSVKPGNTIKFDSLVFPPHDPKTIFIIIELPPIDQGGLIIDASDAGVILDGSKFSTVPAYGLQISSDRNIIQGLQIVNFSEGGIVLSGKAKENVIGGDRNVGEGPIGQGNLISGNNAGIGIWDAGTSHNHITGNLIGTEVSGTIGWGNNIGLSLSDGASYNEIGPNNIIAYNRDYGISIVHPSSLGNVITQNSIHSNGHMGISLQNGGNDAITAPFIIEFDLDTGTLAGSSCPICVIEIYSTEDDEGKIFEGTTLSDDKGVFSFREVDKVLGPQFTVTATDPVKGTSEFSAPTSGSEYSFALQAGNYLPITPFLHKESQFLENNFIGDAISLYPYAYPDHPGFEKPEDFAERINQKGLKWMELSLDWFDGIGDPVDISYFDYIIHPNQDQVINAIKEKRIEPVFTLAFWDKGVQSTESTSRFQTEEEIQSYLDYVKLAVTHLKGRVKYYMILNEPDIGFDIHQHVAAHDYINLVKRTIPVIKNIDPEARIIIGEVSPLIWTDQIEYLFDILQSDLLPVVDGISWHSGGWASPEYMADEYYNYQTLLIEILDIAKSNGFLGEFWATEMHWRTTESPHPHEFDGYSAIAATKYLARSIVMHRGLGIISGLVENLEHEDKMPLIQNLCTILAGANPHKLEVKIMSASSQINTSTFIQPDGDLLVALWSDGIALEIDPGINSEVVISGLVAENVTGIDILIGIKQELIFSHERGSLVIRDLLVKDYPIILRIKYDN
jgi:hypothetical protein